jgi:hypothetical protein
MPANQEATEQFLKILQEYAPPNTTAYVHFWRTRWPLITELGFKTETSGSCWMRDDRTMGACVIIAAESLVAALADGSDIEYREEAFRSLMKTK